MSLRATSVVVLGLALVTGCGGSDGSAPTGAETGRPADPNGGTNGSGSSSGDPNTDPQDPNAPAAPKVVSSLPAADAKGIASDVKIVVKFDRAMDQSSVAAAYTSASIPSPAFAWNGASDELSITPAAPLAYAAGAPDVAAKVYDVRIAKAAKDQSGVPLAADFTLSFSTLRRITAHPPRVSKLSGQVNANLAVNLSALGVGDFWTGSTEMQTRSFVTFDLSSIPEGGVVEKATFGAMESAIAGTPDDDLGAMVIHQCFYPSLSEAFAAEPVTSANVTRAIGLNGAASKRFAELTAIVQDDLANRVARSNQTQIRLLYSTPTDGDSATDRVALDPVSPDLTVIYVSE